MLYCRLTQCLLLLLSLSLISVTAAADPKNTRFDEERLDRVLDMGRQYVDAGLLPDVMYGVVTSRGVVRMASVNEYRPDQLFRIYSLTKPITAVALLMLLEEGKLLLTDPVAMYLPEFENPQVLLPGGSLVPAERPITIRHLLTHTAGLTYGGEETGVSKRYTQADLWNAESLAEFSTKVAALPLVAQPGALWHYSVSLDVLGRVIEVVAGQPFDEFLEARIFKPLNMDDTGFLIKQDELERLVPHYIYREGGMSPAPQETTRDYLSPPFPAGGGGLVSTLPDYLRFAQMLLNGGQLDGVRVLSRKTIELMTMDHLLAMDAKLTVDEAWIGRTENRSGSVDLGFGFGLGGAIIRDVAANGVPGSKGTYGWGGNTNVYFFLDREEDVGGVFFTQLSPSGVYPLRAGFRSLVYQAME